MLVFLCGLFTACSTIGVCHLFLLVYCLLVACSLHFSVIFTQHTHTHAHTHTHTHTHTRTGVPGKPSRPIVSDPSPTSVSARVFFTDLGSGDLQGLSANITQTSSGQTHTQYLQVPAGQQVYQVNGLEGEGRGVNGGEERGGESMDGRGGKGRGVNGGEERGGEGRTGDGSEW